MAQSSTQLFVSNLPWEVDSDGLKQIFQEYGTIEQCTVPVNRGQSRGFGYVTFSSAEEATAALGMDKASVGDGEKAREIGVSYAREKEEKGKPKPKPPGAKAEGSSGGVEEMTQSVPIPANSVGWVMGKGGSNINLMQKQSGCVLRLQDNEWQDFGRKWKYLQLKGSGRNVDRAKKLIYLSLEKFNPEKAE